jgi:3-hydroxyisobutyrate dehydrogenase
VIITIVGFPADVEEVYLGDKGILNHAKKNPLLLI